MNCEGVPICTLSVKSCPYMQLIELFTNLYQIKPKFFVRVPGRVNLIGEHIDYCGYSVCPMALDQDVLLAVSIDTDKMLHLHNTDPKFENYVCSIDNIEINIKEKVPHWYQYYLCGVKGILDILPNDVNLTGMKVVVSGNVPQSAGLSSSSALVSAAALATAHSHKLSISKEKMANLCADCERYIGTQGGGMDQAIAFLANEGCAKHIEFNPLRSTDVTLPGRATFVIAHSLISMNKAATADFNCRVIECRLAAQILAFKQGVDWTKIKRLSELQQALSLNLSQMISLVESTLHEQLYTIDEIVTELGTSFQALEATSLTPNTKQIKTFKLRQRALHVFNEALRVKTFIEVCSRDNAEGDGFNDQVLPTLGRLMSESHESLKELYECSHPQLDRLVELSKNYTFGTRLTGAGWGGCTVSLLSPENVEKYMDFLKENYYKELGIVEGFSSILFATAPRGGACIYV
ncbi:N-acetylgalactosamine kinase isoform X1 [Diorhabda carinulata]|uniref:N-acetylgalactosamine kinase isoform X1 n=1 Tax=Diorhabda carinulata TaxID=1163345 RepID=UPI0025A22915|nr:N-acetylgalactosamine kinase isoform X1 [Diorhabda carinulata]